ncbi:MAG: RnfABCDGE type electron transport complex subunit D [Spirochaetales bacterium]|jgi:electron transport complex protein RnfD|nr:RnfABCDGE type electron transport complex subunit D [Spirochaetales bacterium]
MEDEKLKLITGSPQIHSLASTSRVMGGVILALLPAGIWGVWLFGPRAGAVILVSLAGAAAGELIGAGLMKKNTLADGSAFLTGLLVAYNMPVSVPLYVPATASLFALLVAKWTFGGLGNNWINPALAGRVFVFFSWTSAMTKWTLPVKLTGAAEAVTGATVLGAVKTGLADLGGPGGGGPVEFLKSLDFPASAFAQDLARGFQGLTGLETEALKWDLFFGLTPGCIGEVSTLLLLLGGAALLFTRIINWEIPFFYLGSFALLTGIFGGLPFGKGLFAGDVVFHLLSGGLILGAFFMATDMVTSPLTKKGMIIYALGTGFLTFLIRQYGSFPEGVSLAIILMNIFVPVINRYTGPKRFGVAKTKTKAA